MNKALIQSLFAIVLVSYKYQITDAHKVRDYLIEEQNIPREFINIKKVTNCEKNYDAFMAFCVDENSEVKIQRLDLERTRLIFGPLKKNGFITEATN